MNQSLAYYSLTQFYESLSAIYKLSRHYLICYKDSYIAWMHLFFLNSKQQIKQKFNISSHTNNF